MSSVPESFWKKVERTGACWVWTGYRTPSGYGFFRYNYKMWRAHRFSYVALVGDVPEDWEIHHLCCNPACVNPAHLEAMPPAEHQARHPHGRGRRMHGSIGEIKPGTWRLRVYVGRRPNGTPIQRSVTVIGTREEAERRLTEIVGEVKATAKTAIPPECP